ncbi:MAG: FAD-linked oxidase C-terminal domain-containing protein [Candidatus Bathyarchaeia archaeon]|jgi:FAD/FMN-containing dehydrogenase
MKDRRRGSKSGSDLIREAALKVGGITTGEHGLRRNRSKYLRNEWRDKVYGYFEQIKNIFDSEGLLNSDAVFTSDNLTKNLRF